ncbi:CHASE domain-containing protein [Shewanella sp.]|uniref:CHASE domain-containing protein n=1 Tax=Shewanella sp. TaxID=50422 RepID=UPI003A9858F5
MPSVLHREPVSNNDAMSSFKLPSSVWMLMMFATLFTVIGGYIANYYVHVRGMERFQFQSVLLRDEIADRMRTYEQVLRGGIGLFMSSQSVSRQEWHDYIANARLQEYYPGMQGMGYSVILKPEQLAAHEAEVQAEGFADYKVHPTTPRDSYQAILYIEPFDWRNQRSFGYDMSSEPVRRAAIDRAIATRAAAVSGKITLVQEVARDVQSGFLMCMPLFVQDAQGNATDEPRGIVYAAFRMNNLMEGILGDKFSQLHIKVYDGAQIRPSSLMYQNNASRSNPRYSSVLPVTVGGHIWSLSLSSNANFSSDAEAMQHKLLLVFGGLFLGLLFYFLYQNAKGRFREASFSQQMLANEERFRLVIEASPSALVMVDRQGVMNLVNAHAEKLFKYSRDELLGQKVSMLLPMEARQRHGEHMAGYMRRPDAKNMSQRTDLQGLCSDGSLVDVEVGLTPIIFSDGQAILATINDVSERKQIEKERERYTAELERINRELDSFAYIASHDLKSPLRGIEQLADWLNEDLGDHPRVC